MPQDLSLLEIQEMSTEGFFNELEEDVKNAVHAGGTGFYKLTREKGEGIFVAVEAATHAGDTAVLSTDPVDRLAEEGETHDYLYVKFVV